MNTKHPLFTEKVIASLDDGQLHIRYNFEYDKPVSMKATYFIVHTEATYCIHILFNKSIHNGELAFEMPFVCLQAYNMHRGSK